MHAWVCIGIDTRQDRRRRVGRDGAHISATVPCQAPQSGKEGAIMGWPAFCFERLAEGKRGSPKRDAQRSHRAMSEVGHQSRGGGTVASGARRMGDSRYQGRERSKGKPEEGENTVQDVRRGQQGSAWVLPRALGPGVLGHRNLGHRNQVLGSRKGGCRAALGWRLSRAKPTTFHRTFSPAASLAAVWDRCGDRPGVGELTESTKRTRTRRRHGLASVSC